MTLFKQIAIAMSVLVIALLVVTMYSSYKTNIEFIEDRLYTSAKTRHRRSGSRSVGLPTGVTAPWRRR